ncbi:hypothetical protein RRG08_027590 [Elysia crispata]|uniref:Uncharacterized protein n=1 Tax=Elysia crispata TaxID=231223 RepID=A0AAE1AFG2_9GAST|nr:hypothetical protein RRG08_027590 [Elysia crispata]
MLVDDNCDGVQRQDSPQNSFIAFSRVKVYTLIDNQVTRRRDHQDITRPLQDRLHCTPSRQLDRRCGMHLSATSSGCVMNYGSGDTVAKTL